MGDISNYHDTVSSGQSAFDFTATGASTIDISGARQKACDKALLLAGWKGYVTSLSQEQLSGRGVISFYHDLYHIENAFRMAKTDVQARPIFHRTQDAIRAHLTVVMAALAMSKHIYLASGVTAPKLVEGLKRLRHATVDTGTHRYDIPSTSTKKPRTSSP